MKALLYAHISKEDLYNKGIMLGLTGDALIMFSNYNEVMIEVTIDKQTGTIIDEKIFKEKQFNTQSRRP